MESGSTNVYASTHTVNTLHDELMNLLLLLFRVSVLLLVVKVGKCSPVRVVTVSSFTCIKAGQVGGGAAPPALRARHARRMVEPAVWLDSLPALLARRADARYVVCRMSFTLSLSSSHPFGAWWV